MFRTSNPALSAKSFGGFVGRRTTSDSTTAMTISGAVNKTGLLVLLAIAAGIVPWRMFFAGGPAAVVPFLGGGLLVGFVAALVTIFKKDWAAVTAPIYAIAEGFVLGGLSALFEARYPGIAFQATALTFGTLLALLVAYKSGLIRATENFKLGVVAATGAIALVYLASMVLRLFGVPMTFLHAATPLGIGISLVVVVIAALNLVLDFDFIEQGAGRGAPKYMEWYAAFGLLLTLVWLYLEILHLLAKLNGRRR